MSGNLRKEKLPHSAANFHKNTRAEILQNKSIQNKLIDGTLIEDTAVVEQYESYYPKVDTPDFLLCSKNTLGYLARLKGFEQIMPYTSIIACIRNPLDTIASWKNSFHHLESVSAATQHIIGALNDDFISNWQREQLTKISNESRTSYKRAMYWAYLADWIWENQTRLTIFKYEDIVTSPKENIQKIYKETSSTFPFEIKTDIVSSEIRTNKRNNLSTDDIKAITDICFPVAKKYGYHELG